MRLQKTKTALRENKKEGMDMTKENIERIIKKAWKDEGFYYVCIDFFANEEPYDDNFRATTAEELIENVLDWLENHYWIPEDLVDMEVEFTGEKERELIVW